MKNWESYGSRKIGTRKWRESASPNFFANGNNVVPKSISACCMFKIQMVGAIHFKYKMRVNIPWFLYNDWHQQKHMIISSGICDSSMDQYRGQSRSMAYSQKGGQRKTCSPATPPLPSLKKGQEYLSASSYSPDMLRGLINFCEPRIKQPLPLTSTHRFMWVKFESHESSQEQGPSLIFTVYIEITYYIWIISHIIE